MSIECFTPFYYESLQVGWTLDRKDDGWFVTESLLASGITYVSGAYPTREVALAFIEERRATIGGILDRYRAELTQELGA